MTELSAVPVARAMPWWVRPGLDIDDAGRLRIVGVDAESLARAREHVSAVPGEILAGELMLTPGQARPLPATLAVLDAAVELLGLPLQMVGGGIREGLAIARMRELQTAAQPA